MCGVAGVLFKWEGSPEIASSLINMLDGCRHFSFDCGSCAKVCQAEYKLGYRFMK
jgi:hypothetical protein